IFGTRPSAWAPEDVVRIRSHAKSRNALSEVLRANVMARADARTDLLRKNLDPAVAPGTPEGLDPAAVPRGAVDVLDPAAAPGTPGGLDPAAVPLDAMDVFTLAAAPVTFPPERLGASLDEAWAWTCVNPLGDVVRDADFEGSNNWVIAGDRTGTGRPIMANDPHRLHAVPSLRYVVHLTAPGFDVIGAGEPAVPGISLGHNGSIAFGITLFYTDQEDVY